MLSMNVINILSFTDGAKVAQTQILLRSEFKLYGAHT